MPFDANPMAQDAPMHALRTLLTTSLFAVFLITLSAPSSASAQAPNFSGDYTLDEGASDDFLAAFEPALEEMNPIKRALARRYLKKSEGPDTRLRIEQNGESVTLQGENRPAVTLPLSGERTSHQNDKGETVYLRARFRGAVLHVDMETDGGPFTTEYRMTPGGVLESRVRVVNEHLPMPVTYRLVYRAR